MTEIKRIYAGLLEASGVPSSRKCFQRSPDIVPAARSLRAPIKTRLSDAYLANKQKDLAVSAEEKCLKALPADPMPDPAFKAELRKHAEEKIAKLKPEKNSRND